MKFDVCLETLFKSNPLEQRLELVSRTGFAAYEFWLPGKRDMSALQDANRRTGLETACFVVNSPDGKAGGAPLKREDRETYLRAVEDAATLAVKLGCRRLITCTGNQMENVSRERQTACLIETLREAAETAARAGVMLVLETLNTRHDHAGYFLDSLEDAAALARAVDHPSLRLLVDLYHSQIMQGDLACRIREYASWIGHYHAAGVPGRHEMFDGELNYPFLLETIAATGYDGYFGLEYLPKLPDEESLQRSWELLKPFAA